MSDPQADLRRALRQLNPGQLRRVLLALALAQPRVVERLVADATDRPVPAPKVRGQLELDG